MGAMMLDPELSDWIQEAIERYTLATSNEPEYLKYYVALYNLLPIYPDWTHCYGLRADGTVFLFSTEDEEKTIHQETDERLRNLALFRGAKKYPELKSLVPVRSTDSIDCPACQGLGKIEIPGIEPDVIVCYCGGLGWLPFGTQYPRIDP
jgi:hypothetical protein